MINYPTILKYLAKKFLWYLFLVSLVMIVILFISSAFDILQTFKTLSISPGKFWLLIILKIPFLFNEICTIIGFVSSILFIRYLSSSNELVILTSSGLAMWRVFAIPVIISFIFGTVVVAVINPIGILGLKEFDRVKSKISNFPHNSALISKTGIFFYEQYEHTNRIIQARSINMAEKSLLDITIFIVDENNSLIKRIDSSSAILNNGQFTLHEPLISMEKHGTFVLPTNLSIDNLIQKFTPPEMISIWELPETIEQMNSSGISILHYQLHFFKQLFKPLAIVAMVFLSCLCAQLNNRDNSYIKNIIFVLVIGLCTYFLLEILLHILAFGGLAPIFATLLPILFIILISNFVILHFQEA